MYSRMGCGVATARLSSHSQAGGVWGRGGGDRGGCLATTQAGAPFARRGGGGRREGDHVLLGRLLAAALLQWAAAGVSSFPFARVVDHCKILWVKWEGEGSELRVLCVRFGWLAQGQHEMARGRQGWLQGLLIGRVEATKGRQAHFACHAPTPVAWGAFLPRQVRVGLPCPPTTKRET